MFFRFIVVLKFMETTKIVKKKLWKPPKLAELVKASSLLYNYFRNFEPIRKLDARFHNP